MKIATAPYNVIDLFCGCGGLSKGFEQAGCKILLGVDFDNAPLKTFEYNHTDAKGLQLNLGDKASFDIISDALKGRKVDIVIGGPPCQGFSLTGPRNFDDPRNKLYLAMIEAIHRFRPKAFMIENVPGMGNLYKGAIKEEILRILTDLGYKVSCKIVCAADYGVPQIRQRLVFIGLRNSNIPFEFPTPLLEENQYITCEQAISDLPPLVDNLGEEKSTYTDNPHTEFQKKMRGNCSVLY
ncbi:MAG: DNA cytosine methyltransferase, partial [Muribaculaceae bacterium]|nr:DNA cytosine methyltransferase [Muribaculaceae bacterium]